MNLKHKFDGDLALVRFSNMECWEKRSFVTARVDMINLNLVAEQPRAYLFTLLDASFWNFGFCLPLLLVKLIANFAQNVVLGLAVTHHN